ncbi:SsrA-binding protein [Candidatus Phytoplasma mali]|uniref:SsrA-binding protein n=1 Tax=Phytoplasma mali (strain AT) TaxID=482235 RepID=B3QZX8_PHYMT|nr:SsrA-binding protein SmpB [Candidatus Phytoplasma mali]CAP18515.1 SsrA-binding protein [Candidatus Phytoplasma mali]
MKKNFKIITVNKKAEYDYFLEKKYYAGIKLLGCEIKSIRLGKVNIQNAHIFIKNNEIFIMNMLIDKYKLSCDLFFQEKREKKLLLNKKEIIQIKNKMKIQSLTTIPVKLYLDKHLAKLEIALAKGKKKYDKRNDLKEKTIKLDLKKNYPLI